MKNLNFPIGQSGEASRWMVCLLLTGPTPSSFHIIHIYKQTMNQTKYLVPLLSTFNNQEKSI